MLGRDSGFVSSSRSSEDMAASVAVGAPEIDAYQALGSALEENKQSSHELMSDLASLQERVSLLLGAHGQSLSELGSLRSECTRVTSLLEYESSTRRKVEQDNVRLSADSKETRSQNAQLHIELDALDEEMGKLQIQHEMMSKEFTIVETRLLDAERELSERAGQYDQASALLKRTQQELDLRNREFATIREKYELEQTAHQLLIETTRRESGVHTRELARFNEEKTHLRSSLTQQEALVRNLQLNSGNLKQELSIVEERYRRLGEEFENLQATSALEAAQLTTKLEAVGSKAELVEKLLMTANGRNRMTDEELQTSRAELKRVKSDLATSSARAERFEAEVVRIRATGMQSEAARRELAAQCNELTMRLKDSEEQRNRRDRDAETRRQDMDMRAESDRHEVDQLRTSLEIAKSEIRQLRAERAILSGQLEVARSDRAGTASAEVAQPQNPAPSRPADAQPLIDISEKSLRNAAVIFEEQSSPKIEMPRVTPFE
jgi:chromosome segregation ATPase